VNEAPLDGADIIAEILRQRRELESTKRKPERIVMSMAAYRAVQDFHARLGELPNPDIDYIRKYRIFGLDIFIDNARSLTVEVGDVSEGTE
jgi:hypothetical protein